MSEQGTRVHVGAQTFYLADITPAVAAVAADKLTGAPTWVELDDGVLVRPSSVDSLSPYDSEDKA